MPNKAELINMWSKVGVGSSFSKLLQFPELYLLNDNLSSSRSRSLMIISHNQAAKHILFNSASRSLLPSLKGREITALEGDLFGECSEYQMHKYLHEVRVAMEEGKILVLVNLSLLYESLYDVLNKNYTHFSPGVMYAKIVVGRHSESCLVKENFKVIVVVDPYDAYFRLSPPFLNRFEKHTLDYIDVLDGRDQKDILTELISWVVDLCKQVTLSIKQPFQPQQLFFGYHRQFIASLVASVVPQKGVKETIEECKSALQRMIKPEGLIQLILSTSHSNSLHNFVDNYFKQWNYSSLLELLTVKVPQ